MRTQSDRRASTIVTGAEYNALITARESDRRARAAFRDRVIALAPAGGTLFDFGCGTGMDARFYAERGFRVMAYDVDPRMCEYFSSYCREMVESGRVTLQQGSYRDFLASLRVGDQTGVDLVTANFAPLNLIDDLRELFAAFHAITAPHASLLASVLSPYFVGDVRYGWWWRNLPALIREGRYSLPGAQASIYRRRIADFAAQGAPYFRLERVFSGLPPTHARYTRGIEVGRVPGGAWRRLTTCRYMFLQFSRRTGYAGSQRHQPTAC